MNLWLPHGFLGLGVDPKYVVPWLSSCLFLPSLFWWVHVFSFPVSPESNIQSDRCIPFFFRKTCFFKQMPLPKALRSGFAKSCPFASCPYYCRPGLDDIPPKKLDDVPEGFKFVSSLVSSPCLGDRFGSDSFLPYSIQGVANTGQRRTSGVATLKMPTLWMATSREKWPNMWQMASFFRGHAGFAEGSSFNNDWSTYAPPAEVRSQGLRAGLKGKSSWWWQLHPGWEGKSNRLLTHQLMGFGNGKL